MAQVVSPMTKYTEVRDVERLMSEPLTEYAQQKQVPAKGVVGAVRRTFRSVCDLFSDFIYLLVL